jgi:hypothetical protein
MGKGYGDGPASEELLAEPGEAARGGRTRDAVYGATDDDPRPHFLGWRDEVDPDELFASGRAWGLSVRPRRAVAP